MRTFLTKAIIQYTNQDIATLVLKVIHSIINENILALLTNAINSSYESRHVHIGSKNN